MLRKAMHIVERLGTVQLSMIARELRISELLARQILDELTRLGYLHVVTTKDSVVSCSDCPMRISCQHRMQAQIWMITNKGQQLLSQE